MKKERKFMLLSDVYGFFKKGVIYKESHISINNQLVSSQAKNHPSHWQEVFEEEPTLEFLTDQIKELAKNQGMKCDVVLEKKKDVEVNDFQVMVTSYLEISMVSFSINLDPKKIFDKESEIIKAIKTILEN